MINAYLFICFLYFCTLFLVLTIAAVDALDISRLRCLHVRRALGPTLPSKPQMIECKLISIF